MRYNDDDYDYSLHNMQYSRTCDKTYPEHKRYDCQCDNERELCGDCCKDICINNNPVINICIDGYSNGIKPPKPFLSSYMEALGKEQTVSAGENVVFSYDTIDSVGDNIELDASGTVFTINEPGLYHVEWNLNLADGTTSAVVGIVENGEPASGSAASAGGSFSSGTLIQVDEVPFTLSLRNYNGEITIEDIPPFENSAASIRIVRFADGPSV